MSYGNMTHEELGNTWYKNATRQVSDQRFKDWDTFLVSLIDKFNSHTNNPLVQDIVIRALERRDEISKDFILDHLHRDHRAGDGFLRLGAGRSGALLRRHRRRSDDDQLRHDDQQRASGNGARADGLVVAGGGLRFHVYAGAGGQPAGRCNARCL